MSTTASEQDPLPHQDSFGAFARRLRQARGLTLKQAALASGVGRVTLIRWENAAQRPRLPELTAFLTALGVGVGERRQAMALLDTPGTYALVRKEVTQVGVRLGLGPQPDGSDLLRALRRRRGLSPEETAARIGVTVRTLRRWERGEAWPPMDRLHALCRTLDAHEEELIALTVGNFSASPLETLPTIEEVSQDLNQLHEQIQRGEQTLVELRYLILETQVWRLAVQGNVGRDLLQSVLHCQAIDLGCRGDTETARRLAERVITLGPGMGGPSNAWIYCGVLVAISLLRTGHSGDARNAWKMLRPLLGATRLVYIRSWILSSMADCLVVQGAGEEALALGDESCRVALKSEYPGEWRLRRQEQSARLLRLGRSIEALACIEGIEGPNPFHGIELFLCRSEALLGVGDPDGAAEWLRHAYARIEAYDLAHMRGPLDHLAARLVA